MFSAKMDVRLCGLLMVVGLAGCDVMPIRIQVDTAASSLPWLQAINWTLNKLQPALKGEVDLAR